MAQEEKQKGMLVHLLSIFFGFLAPLIMYLMATEQESFLKEHAKESLNFQISFFIYIFVCGMLSFLIIPIIAMIGLWIFGIIQMIQACMVANNGEPFKYGLTIPFIK